MPGGGGWWRWRWPQGCSPGARARRTGVRRPRRRRPQPPRRPQKAPRPPGSLGRVIPASLRGRRRVGHPWRRPPRRPPAPAGKYRAFWVDAFHPGIKSPAEIDQLLRDVQAANANMVVVQVRRRGDVYYNRSIEPRAYELARQPADFDPLALLIEKAHAATPRIEVHAWLATLPVARRDDTPQTPGHVFVLHGPQAPGEDLWLSQTATGLFTAEDNYFLDPGHPRPPSTPLSATWR